MRPVERFLVALVAGWLALWGCHSYLPKAYVPTNNESGAAYYQTVASHYIYVTDKTNLVVYPTGSDTPVRTVALGATGYGVVADSRGNVYVALPGQNTVAIYSPGGESKIGSISVAAPTGLAVDVDDTLYIASGQGSFSEFPLGWTKPYEVVKTGGGEMGIAVANPDDVFVDVIDGGPSIVQEYVNTMHPHAAIGAPTPAGLAIDAQGLLNVGAANYIYTYTLPMTWLPQPARKHFYPIGNNVRLLTRGQNGRLYVPVFGAPAVDIYVPGATQATRRLTKGLTAPFGATEG